MAACGRCEKDLAMVAAVEFHLSTNMLLSELQHRMKNTDLKVIDVLELATLTQWMEIIGEYPAAVFCWVNNHMAGDLRRNRAHYDVSIMTNLDGCKFGPDCDYPCHCKNNDMCDPLDAVARMAVMTLFWEKMDILVGLGVATGVNLVSCVAHWGES